MCEILDPNYTGWIMISDYERFLMSNDEED